MNERAFKLKDAIELYQQHFRQDASEPTEDDILTSEDWRELKDILDLLSPLREASKAIQCAGKFEDQYHHGSRFESLQAIDFLLTKLEKLKQEHYHLPNSHFKACINLGWKKLNKYYELSDNTAAYRAAIALHPSFKMRWFEQKWSDSHPQWIGDAKNATQELFHEYNRRHGDEGIAVATVPTPPDKLTEFERYNIIQDEQYNGNELDRFLAEDRVPSGTNPLIWWQLNQDRYPVLRHMAFDLLAAPASSSADERQFSQAGHVLDEDHYNTKDDLAEAYQCLKSAYAEGIKFTLSDC
jgi:hypothetical protein